ncbi:MAG: hypothetical protein CSA81_06075 [Acidobacteria bacterium]|nr:MAG: hypothetical protein CSA81_06075 [Acidobacteriota bacterium]PIE89622.1 MAG: hypothetical protein CR997_10435 [Acidobacteriota bacterium]
MLSTIIRINWLHLKRDYVSLGLTFILPIVFFSIFASIFGSMGKKSPGSSEMKKITCLVIDEDQSRISKRFSELLKSNPTLNVPTLHSENGETISTREQAWQAVRKGKAPIALVFPPGFGERFGFMQSEGLPIEMIYDPSHPIAPFAVSGLLQGAAMRAAPDVFVDEGLSYFEIYGGELTEQQKKAVAEMKPFLQGEQTLEDGSEPAEAFSEMVPIKRTNVQQLETPGQPAAENTGKMVSYYAAAIGVMFLLFSMTAAAGSILEEEEAGTLERILTSKVSMTHLLLGKWLFFTGMGFTQVMIMFIWASALFGLTLWTPYFLTGSILVSIFTAAAAAAFGLFLAVLCRSRSQLGGISTIVILIMSAIGGSMIPRMLMPDIMQKLGKFTFNGQALDGYLKVFWHFDPTQSNWHNLAALYPQVLILLGMTLVGLAAARLIARRWEQV